MDHITVTYIILTAAGVIGLASFAYLIFIPAWTAYGRTWERLAAGFLSLFVLAAFAGTGLAIGLVLLYYWDEILNFLQIQDAIAPFL